MQGARFTTYFSVARLTAALVKVVETIYEQTNILKLKIEIAFKNPNWWSFKLGFTELLFVTD